MAQVMEHGDEELYNKLDSSYPTEDDDSEVVNKQLYGCSFLCTDFEILYTFLRTFKHQQDEEGEGDDDTQLEDYDSSNDLSDEIDELTNDNRLESFAFDSEEDTSETEHILT